MKNNTVVNIQGAVWKLIASYLQRSGSRISFKLLIRIAAFFFCLSLSRPFFSLTLHQMLFLRIHSRFFFTPTLLSPIASFLSLICTVRAVGESHRWSVVALSNRLRGACRDPFDKSPDALSSTKRKNWRNALLTARGPRMLLTKMLIELWKGYLLEDNCFRIWDKNFWLKKTTSLTGEKLKLIVDLHKNWLLDLQFWTRELWILNLKLAIQEP